MLDEHMEKKISARGSTVPAKSVPNEAKSKQDGTGGNAKFPRSTRRREGLASKQDPATKLQQPQRQKGNYDKRFQTKNTIVSTSDRHGNQMTMEQETEIGSADRPGSRKLNLNHLLNFTYDRPDGARTSGQSWISKENRGRAIWTTRKHKYNKEQFLQANCQFIVQEGHDYSVHSSDPDLLVDWEWIEQVQVNSHEVPSCPICLYPPVAAKMTRCGHIYCWSCMLHYLALSDKTWRKCPICYEAVHKTDLKSVATLATPCFNVGDKISMQLMCREKGSMVTMPKSRAKKSTSCPFRLNEGIDQCYAKLLLAGHQQVLESVIDREELELEQALQEYAACPEICFIESAIEQLKERKISLLANVVQPKLELINDSEDVDKSILNCHDNEPMANVGGLSSDEAGGCSDGAVGMLLKTEENSALMAGSMDDTNEETFNSGGGLAAKMGSGPQVYYFYQACDGQHIYMHAINVHMLMREYGSLEMCPDVITAVIVEKEGISMNEGLRKRLRYLGHLPLICEFEVVELQLEVPDVSQETIDAFTEEIEKRQRRRNHRAREEHKRERQFQADENRRMGKIPEARLRLNSLKHFPECNTRCNEDELTLPPNGDDCPQLSPGLENGTEVELPVTENAYSGPSFAQMLRKGKVKTEVSTQRRTSSNSGASVSFERKAGSSEDDDESLHAPSFRDSFCAALQDALDRSVADSLSDEQPSGSKKKKRGRQKRLLFSTSVVRSK